MSMMNMKAAKERLMVIAGNTYHAIKYELTDYGDGNAKQRCAVYAQDKGWFEADHWDNALGALENAIAGKPPISEDLPVSDKAV